MPSDCWLGRRAARAPVLRPVCGGVHSFWSRPGSGRAVRLSTPDRAIQQVQRGVFWEEESRNLRHPWTGAQAKLPGGEDRAPAARPDTACASTLPPPRPEGDARLASAGSQVEGWLTNGLGCACGAQQMLFRPYHARLYQGQRGRRSSSVSSGRAPGGVPISPCTRGEVSSAGWVTAAGRCGPAARALLNSSGPGSGNQVRTFFATYT